MRRGDIFWIDLEPVRGSESNKKRPCLIVSCNEANDYARQSGRGTVTVLPITSNTAFVASFQVLLPASESALPRDSKIQTEQIRSVSVQRLGDYIGSVSHRVLWQVEHALKLHLALPS